MSIYHVLNEIEKTEIGAIWIRIIEREKEKKAVVNANYILFFIQFSKIEY
jgi:hypothetical protein